MRRHLITHGILIAIALGFAPIIGCDRNAASPSIHAEALSAGPIPTPREPPKIKPGAFSKAAAHVSDFWVAGFDDPTTVAVITAPDGRSRVEFQLNATDKAESISLRLRGALGEADYVFNSSPNYEIGWAPDSQAFFITENDGGAVGSFLLHVIGRYGGKLRHLELTPVIERAYGQPGKCFDPEEPNVAGLTWLGSSRRLVGVAETLPHSNCDNMGTFKAYEVDLPSMKIVRSWGQLEAKAKFRETMGEELVNATDECFTKPEFCEIPQLHGRNPG